MVPSLTPEQTAVYKTLAMLDTHKERAMRVSFAGGYVQSVKDNLGIDLKRLRLESSMNDVATSADGILISLSDL